MDDVLLIIEECAMSWDGDISASGGQQLDHWKISVSTCYGKWGALLQSMWTKPGASCGVQQCRWCEHQRIFDLFVVVVCYHLLEGGHFYKFSALHIALNCGIQLEYGTHSTAELLEVIDKELILLSKTLEVSRVDVEDTHHLQELCLRGDNIVEHDTSILWSSLAFISQLLEEADDLPRV